MTKQPEINNFDLIAKDISYIQRDMANMALNIKDLAGTYATKTALAEVKKEIDEMKRQLDSIEISVSNKEKSMNVGKLIIGVTTAIVTFIITYLVQFYLANSPR